jgi:hypothetical protein
MLKQIIHIELEQINNSVRTNQPLIPDKSQVNLATGMRFLHNIGKIVFSAIVFPCSLIG